MLFRLSVRENEVLTEKDEDFIFLRGIRKMPIILTSTKRAPMLTRYEVNSRSYDQKCVMIISLFY